MRSVKIWEQGKSSQGQEVVLSESTPDEKYVCIRDDLDETIVIPVDKWDEFIKACQELEITA